MANPTIHIIEDDPVFGIILERHLSRHGFNKVRIFESGEACLDEINAGKGPKPGFVFLDFSLGGLNGLDVLKKLKKILSKTKVFIITSLEDEKLKANCMANGADDFYTKTEVSEDLPESLLKNMKKRSFLGF